MIEAPRFTLAEAAQAIDVPLGTVRNWLARAGFELDPSDVAAPAGGIRRLTLSSVVRLAIAGELAGYGIAPRYAFRAATTFSDVQSHAPEREPGHLFPSGWTVLIVWKPAANWTEAAPSAIAEVIHVPDGHGLPFDVFNRTRAGRTLQDSFVAIWLNPIFNNVKHRLGGRSAVEAD